MLSALIIGISTFTSILWSIVFLLPQYFDYVLYHISGNMLNSFIPSIKTYSYSSNEEPNGWIVGWTDGFYIGYLSCSTGNGPHGPMKNLYIFTSKKFYNTYISKNGNENNNDNDNEKQNKNKLLSHEKKLLHYILEKVLIIIYPIYLIIIRHLKSYFLQDLHNH